MNQVNKTVGKKITNNAGAISLLILVAIGATSGIAMTVPGVAYADEPHKQRCTSIAGDGGNAGDNKNRGDAKAGDAGKAGKGGKGGHIGIDAYRASDTNIEKIRTGKGGAGGDANGGDGTISQNARGGDGGKSWLACIIVDPDLTIKPTLVVPEEAFEPRPHR
jgi:hypothetical protein